MLCTLEGHMGSVNAVAVTPDGCQAISGSDDSTLKVWDLQRGEVLRTLGGHRGGVNAVAVTPDGRHVVSGSSDVTLKVWDLKRGVELRTLECYQSTSLYSADDPLALVEEVASEVRKKKMSVNAVAVTPDGRYAVSGSVGNPLQLWDLSRGEQVRTLKGGVLGGADNAVAVTPDGRHAVSGSGRGTLKVWDLSRGEEVRTLEGHHTGGVFEEGVSAVAVTPDGRYAVSGSSDTTLKVWDLVGGTLVATFRGEGGLSACAVGSDGQTIVAGDVSGRVHFLRLEGIGPPAESVT
jgi:hypothetical protein